MNWGLVWGSINKQKNCVWQGENHGHKYFLLDSQCFQMVVSSEPLKPGCVVESKFMQLNSLSNNKILVLSKFKAFADYSLNVAKWQEYVFDRVENIVGKGENAGYQHYLLFPQSFQKDSSSGLLKFGTVC